MFVVDAQRKRTFGRIELCPMPQFTNSAGEFQFNGEYLHTFNPYGVCREKRIATKLRALSPST